MKKLNLLLALLLLASGSFAQNYWNPVSSGTNEHLLSVSFGNASVGYIGGTDSLLLKTTNGGLSWAPVTHSGFDFPLNAHDIVDVNFLSATTGFAIVGNAANPLYVGTLYKTIDGGQTWTELNTGNIAAYTSFFFDENNGYEVGSAFFQGQTLIQLSNGSWGNDQNFHYDPFYFLFAVDFYDTNIGVTGGTAGLIYRTVDAGQHWDTVQAPIDSAVRGLKFIDDHTILGVTDELMGGIIISTDTGKTWQVDMNSLTFFYPCMKSIAISAKDSFIAVGKETNTGGGVILWHEGFNNVMGTAHPLWDVAMVDDSIAYIVGDSGLILSNRIIATNIGGTKNGKDEIHIYPNPSEGAFTIELPQADYISVLDVTGKIIYKTASAARKHRIDLSGQPKAVYLIKAGEGKHSMVRRVVLE